MHNIENENLVTITFTITRLLSERDHDIAKRETTI
jgi:hypothetical protein